MNKNNYYMCGIAGLINDENIDKNYLNKIISNLYNRGPDNQDFWLDNKRKFCFIHILDFLYSIYQKTEISQ